MLNVCWSLQCVTKHLYVWHDKRNGANILSRIVRLKSSTNGLGRIYCCGRGAKKKNICTSTCVHKHVHSHLSWIKRIPVSKRHAHYTRRKAFQKSMLIWLANSERKRTEKHLFPIKIHEFFLRCSRSNIIFGKTWQSQSSALSSGDTLKKFRNDISTYYYTSTFDLFYPTISTSRC